MFAANLKALRAAHKLSLVELAAKADISREYLWRLEQGKQSPGWDKACALADVFGVTLDYFRTSHSPKKSRKILGKSLDNVNS